MAKLYGSYGPDDKYMQQWNSAPASTRAYMIDPTDEKRWKYKADQEEKDKTIWAGIKDPFAYALGDKGPNNVGNEFYPGMDDPNATPLTGTPTPATPPPIGSNQPSPAPSTGQWWNQPYTPAPNTGGVSYANAPAAPTLNANSTSPITGGVNTQPAPGVPTMSKVGSPTGNMAGITTGMANTANKAVTTPGIAGGMQTMPGTNPTMDTTTSGTTTPPKTPQIGVDANGHLTLDGVPLARNDPRMWGNVGRNVLDPSTAAPGSLDAANYDPEFYEPYQYPTGDSDTATAYRLKPQYAHLAGWTQVGSSGIGGPGEIKDPSKLVWDNQFGLLSPVSNINPPDSNWLNEGGIFALAALPFLGPMALEAFSGAGAAGVDFATGAGLGGSAGEAAATAGMGGMGATGAGLIPTAAMLTESAIPAGLTSAGTSGILGTGLTGSQLLSGARTAMSGVGLVNNLLNGGGGGSTNGGGSTLGNILTGALGTGATNHNLGNYEDRVDALINRSDPYGPYRQKGIEGLHKLVDNPGALASNPLFSAMQDKSDMNLQRVMAARGYLGSGNEMGALHENFSANLNKFYGEEFNRYARMAGIDMKPSTEAGIVSAGVGAATRQSRNAGIASFINSNGGLGGVFNLINSWLNSDGEQPLTDEQFDSWWNNYTSSNDDVEFPPGDAGDYNG